MTVLLVPRPGASVRLAAAARAAMHLAATLCGASCELVRYVGPNRAADPYLAAGRHAPVILVHGYGGTEEVWGSLRQALVDAGLSYVVALRYNAVTCGVADVADQLVEEARIAAGRTGGATVHIVGHSLGGLVARYAVQWRGLATDVLTVVTIATPHSGTSFAWLGPGACARQMRPRSVFLDNLRSTRPQPGTRWVAYYSAANRVVRPGSGMLDEGWCDVMNVQVPDSGHFSITQHAGVVSSIVAELIGSEDRRQQPIAA